MRHRPRVMPHRTWLRALRWLVAALVLALVPIPATAADRAVDGVVLVEAEASTAGTRERTARRDGAEVQATAPARAPAQTRVRERTAAHRPANDVPSAGRARIYILHCALLR